MKDDRQLLERLLQRDGRALRYASRRLRGDRQTTYSGELGRLTGGPQKRSFANGRGKYMEYNGMTGGEVVSPRVLCGVIAPYIYLGGGFKYFLCSPLVGEMIQFD